MIKNWNKSIRYDQTQNATEAIIRKILAEKKINRGYLESCGASAFSCLMEGLGFLEPNKYPHINGVKIQFDDFVMMHINDPRNDYSSGDVMDNRAIYNYPKLAKELFNCIATVVKNASFEDLQTEIRRGNAIQICTKKHYIACGDTTKNSILYSDSWDRTNYGWELKNHGWNEELTKEMYMHKDTVNLAIIYYKK